MKALEFSRKPARYAAAMVAGALKPGAGAGVGPLRLRDLDPPELPAPGWVRFRPRLAGICGSDLSTIDGHSSRYFEPIVSFPFVPGHEVVGDLEDGTRAVLIPVLHCAIRGIDAVCDACAEGHINRCERIAFGHLEPGLQTGFCCDTGGGWSEEMVAHPDQLLPVPDDLTDEAAVMIEPTACAVHANRQVHRLSSHNDTDGPIALIGAGALGLLTLAALTHGGRSDVVVAARYAHQRRLAKELGADRVVEPDELAGAIRLATRSMRYGAQLTGGAPVVIDCVGSEASLTQALQVVAPGGSILVVGMPATVSLDLTGLWHREVALRGVYAYDHHDFRTAVDLVANADLGRLVTQTYRLDRFTDAIAHAAEAGRRGAVRIAFDLRTSTP